MRFEENKFVANEWCWETPNELHPEDKRWKEVMNWKIYLVYFTLNLIIGKYGRHLEAIYCDNSDWDKQTIISEIALGVRKPTDHHLWRFV